MFKINKALTAATRFSVQQRGAVQFNSRAQKLRMLPNQLKMNNLRLFSAQPQ